MFKLNEHKKKVIYISIGILILLFLYALKNTNYFVRVSTFLLAVILFYLADVFFGLKFKNYHYLIFILISTSGILFSPFYFLYPNYDKILHFVNPFLLGFLIYFLINKTELKFSTKLLITCSIIIAFLTLFEIGEYLLDQLFDLKLQGVYTINKLNILMDRNDDTMIDLILGTIGALAFAGYKSIIFNFKKLRGSRTLKKK